MQSHLKLPALYAVFFLSGICGLGYQVVWTRMFTTGLGHELPAMLAVVTAFFGGLSVGAWLLDGPVSRSSRPGRWYAGLELVMGLWGFLSILFIPHFNDLSLRLIGIDAMPLRQWLVAFVLPMLALLPATAAMGATLPAMERFVAPLTGDGRCVAALYAVNTFGAVVGAMASAFLFVPAIGFRSTILLLGAVNVVCALIVLRIERGKHIQPHVAKRTSFAAVPPIRLSLTVFFTGLLGIGYEVLGVRALGQVLEGTIYTFTVTLAVYLLGTTIGAAFYQWKLRRVTFVPALSTLLFSISVSCLFGMWTLSHASSCFERLRAAWGDSPWAVGAAELTVAATVFGLPAVFMGAGFTHLAQWAKREGGGVGRAVSLNTLGGAIAPVLFGVILLPGIGLKWSLVIVAISYLILAGTIEWSEMTRPQPGPLPEEREKLRSRPLALGLTGWRCVGLVVPIGLVFLLPARLLFVQVPPRGRLVEFREGMMDSVAVVEHFDNNLSLLVNNRFAMGGTGSVNAERRHAHIPLLLHPYPKRALFLGLGTGITFAAAGSHANLKADGVELVSEVVEAMPRFKPYNDAALGGADLKVHVADARRFVRATSTHYDVIVGDLFHPARDGAGALYTLEHFQGIRQRLAPGGLFCQWLPLHQLDGAMLRVIIRTFLKVFPDARAWLLRFNVDTPVLGLIGTLEPMQYSSGWFAKRVGDAGLLEQLKPLTLTDEFQLLGCLVASPDGLRQFSDGAEINTDDQPVVMCGAPRFTYQHNAPAYSRLLTLLDQHAANFDELIQGEKPVDVIRLRRQLAEFVKARDVYLRGLVAETENRFSEAVDAYVESARFSPAFSTGYARCLTIAMQQSGSNPKAARALLQRLVDAQPERPVARQLLDRLPEK
jgi:spermidine synthase